MNKAKDCVNFKSIDKDIKIKSCVFCEKQCECWKDDLYKFYKKNEEFINIDKLKNQIFKSIDDYLNVNVDWNQVENIDIIFDSFLGITFDFYNKDKDVIFTFFFTNLKLLESLSIIEKELVDLMKEE